jgi:glucokinase
MDLSQQLAIGIDVGGTNTKYGIVNHRGEILKKGELKTDAYPLIEDFIDALYEAIQPILKDMGKEFAAKGIGPTAIIIQAPSTTHPTCTGRV